MAYKYRYDFLRTWMKAHGKTRKEILNAIGTQDYKTCNKWINGTTSMPIGYMIDFCTYFDVDVLEFFEKDGLPLSEILEKKNKTNESDMKSNEKWMQKVIETQSRQIDMLGQIVQRFQLENKK